MDEGDGDPPPILEPASESGSDDTVIETDQGLRPRVRNPALRLGLRPRPMDENKPSLKAELEQAEKEADLKSKIDSSLLRLDSESSSEYKGPRPVLSSNPTVPEEVDIFLPGLNAWEKRRLKKLKEVKQSGSTVDPDPSILSPDEFLRLRKLSYCRSDLRKTIDSIRIRGAAFAPMYKSNVDEAASSSDSEDESIKPPSTAKKWVKFLFGIMADTKLSQFHLARVKSEIFCQDVEDSAEKMAQFKDFQDALDDIREACLLDVEFIKKSEFAATKLCELYGLRPHEEVCSISRQFSDNLFKVVAKAITLIRDEVDRLMCLDMFPSFWEMKRRLTVVLGQLQPVEPLDEEPNICPKEQDESDIRLARRAVHALAILTPYLSANRATTKVRACKLRTLAGLSLHYSRSGGNPDWDLMARLWYDAMTVRKERFSTTILESIVEAKAGLAEDKRSPAGHKILAAAKAEISHKDVLALIEEERTIKDQTPPADSEIARRVAARALELVAEKRAAANDELVWKSYFEAERTGETPKPVPAAEIEALALQVAHEALETIAEEKAKSQSKSTGSRAAGMGLKRTREAKAKARLLRKGRPGLSDKELSVQEEDQDDNTAQKSKNFRRLVHLDYDITAAATKAACRHQGRIRDGKSVVCIPTYKKLGNPKNPIGPKLPELVTKALATFRESPEKGKGEYKCPHDKYQWSESWVDAKGAYQPTFSAIVFVGQPRFLRKNPIFIINEAEAFDWFDELMHYTDKESGKRIFTPETLLDPAALHERFKAITLEGIHDLQVRSTGSSSYMCSKHSHETKSWEDSKLPINIRTCQLGEMTNACWFGQSDHLKSRSTCEQETQTSNHDGSGSN